jgi:hypothetical protein
MTADVSKMSAADRLKLFEDQTLGADVPRVGAKIEDGSGSRYAGLCAADKQHHADLLKLVETEASLATAADAYAGAQAAHAAALKAVSASARHATVQAEVEEA